MVAMAKSWAKEPSLEDAGEWQHTEEGLENENGANQDRHEDEESINSVDGNEDSERIRLMETKDTNA